MRFHFLKPIAGLIILLITPSMLHAQLGFEPDRTVKETRLSIIKNTILTVDDDAKDILIRPFRNPKFELNAVKLFSLIVTDYATTKAFQDYIEPLDQYLKPYISFPTILNQTPFLRNATTGKDGYIYFGFTAMYGAGLLTGNEKLQEASLLTTKAVIESYVVSHLILKTLIARHRPARPLGDYSEMDNDSEYPFVHSPFDFFNFHIPVLGSDAYGTGFPSYHATMYYSIASVMSRVYDNRWLPYSIMTLGMMHSIRGHNHWVSELVAGYVIGNFIGKMVYENYHQQRSLSNTIKPKKKYTADMSVGQTFGVLGPCLTISW